VVKAWPEQTLHEIRNLPGFVLVDIGKGLSNELREVSSEVLGEIQDNLKRRRRVFSGLPRN
jgi:hypothetical protein